MSQNEARPNELDLAAYWMPFTANRQFKANPRMLVSAQGMHYTRGGRAQGAGRHGRASGASTPATAGPRSPQAVARQLETLDYAPPSRWATQAPSSLRRGWPSWRPTGLDRIFFTNSGSESVDTALKIALAYHRARGEGQRTRVIGRERGYHGVSFGGMSVGGIVDNRRTFRAAAGRRPPAATPTTSRRNAFSRGPPEHGAELADELERHRGPAWRRDHRRGDRRAGGRIDRACCCRRRAIWSGCARSATTRHPADLRRGDHRLRAPGHALRRRSISASRPTSYHGQGHHQRRHADGRGVRQARASTTPSCEGRPSGIEFFHGYTYSGHPVACAAGLATLDIYEREGLLTRAAASRRSGRRPCTACAICRMSSTSAPSA